MSGKCEIVVNKKPVETMKVPEYGEVFRWCGRTYMRVKCDDNMNAKVGLSYRGLHLNDIVAVCFETGLVRWVTDSWNTHNDNIPCTAKIEVTEC